MDSRIFKKDKLEVKIFDTRDNMGKVAADDIAEAIKKLLAEKEEINMIFAAAPSQNDMLLHLCEKEDVDWERINAFHMDEYIGIDPDAPQCFSNFLKKYIFDLKPFKSVNLINAAAKDPQEECDRYTKLLKENPNTRQAVIHLKSARDVTAKPTKDLPCTISLQFFIRDEKLYMTTYMRSNDIWMGFPYDVFQFTCMQIYLAMRLNVKLGTYTHIAGSLHLYKRNYKEDINEN